MVISKKYLIWKPSLVLEKWNVFDNLKQVQMTFLKLRYWRESRSERQKHVFDWQQQQQHQSLVSVVVWFLKSFLQMYTSRPSVSVCLHPLRLVLCVVVCLFILREDLTLLPADLTDRCLTWLDLCPALSVHVNTLNSLHIYTVKAFICIHTCLCVCVFKPPRCRSVYILTVEVDPSFTSLPLPVASLKLH